MSDTTAPKIALTATGPLSGKSTLARYMRDTHGFVIASHIDTLVQEYVRIHNAQNFVEPHWTVEQVFADKESHRQALQDFGYHVGFNNVELIPYWTDRTIAASGWREESGRGLLYDSFRGEAQGSWLRALGFILVQISISEQERKSRAKSMKKRYQDVRKAMLLRPELELGIRDPDLELYGELPTPELARSVLAFAQGVYDAKQQRLPVTQP